MVQKEGSITLINLEEGYLQYFWHQGAAHSTGIPAGTYVTQVTEEEFKNNPTGQPNLLLRADSVNLRSGTDIYLQAGVIEENTNLTGIKIFKGGLEAGTFNSDDYIYAWGGEDRNDRTISINSSDNKKDWRLIAGKKFGVDKAGNLYAENVHISGTVTVGAGSNVYTTDDTNPLLIGGRNLIPATKSWSLHNGTWTIASETYGDFSVITHTWASGNVDGGIWINLESNHKIDIKPDTDYVLSFWAKADANGRKLRQHFYPNLCASCQSSTGQTSTAVDGAITVTLTTEWKRYWVKWHTKTSISGNHSLIVGRAFETGTYYLAGAKFEEGNKATDWTPAPEDIQAEIDAKKSVHTLTSSYSQPYATLISWVEEGKDAGNWHVTSTAGVKVGDTVRIKCTVSDMSNTPVYCIGTVTSVDSSTILHMISHGIDTTVIDGGKILTNSIGANQIQANSINARHLSISDTTNLATINEYIASSLTGIGWSGANYLVTDGTWIRKQDATQLYLMFTDRSPSSFKQNDEIYYEFYIKGDVAASSGVVFNVYGYNSAGSNVVYKGVSLTLGTANPSTPVSGTIKLDSAEWNSAVSYIMGVQDNRSTKSQIYIRRVVVRKKNGGELIVDGSITANKIEIGTKDSLTSGRNLFRGSTLMDVANFSTNIGTSGYVFGYNGMTQQKFAKYAEGVNLCDVTLTSVSNLGIGFYRLASEMQLDTSAKYTISCWARCSTNEASLAIGLTYQKTDGTWVYRGGTNATKFVTANSWQYFTLTFTPDADTKAIGYCFTSNYGNNAKLYIRHCKLEKGTIATEWSPAPEDEYLAGGANLLRSEYMSRTPTGYNFLQLYLTEPLIKHQTYTLQLWGVNLDAGSTGINVYWGGGSNPIHGFSEIIASDDNLKPDANGYIKFVFTVSPSNVEHTQAANLWLNLYNMVGSHSGSNCTVTQWKLEKGVVGSDWTAYGPEKVATNYITKIDSAGIFISPENQSPTTSATGNSIRLDGNGLEIFKAGTSVAFYGDTARIGKVNAAHSVIDADGQRFYASNGTTQLANIGYGSGASTSGTAIAPYYSFGSRIGTIGNWSVVEGWQNTASNFGSHAEGGSTEASGPYSHAEGYNTTASEQYSHAEGYGTIASYHSSHAEGSNTTASSWSSHAEGSNTIASGPYSHAEGYGTVASGEASHAEGTYAYTEGNSSHAEGYGTSAYGDYSHAEGKNASAVGNYSHAEGYIIRAVGDYSHAQNLGTNAGYSCQTVIGKYNSNLSDTALEIGKGSDDNNRSNAMIVKWTGQTTIAGTLTQSSDRRLKDHREYLDDKSITLINALKPAHFYKDQESHVGLYAQDVEDIDPYKSLVGEMNGFKTLNYIELVPHLITYCQHLEKELTNLKEKIND